MQPPPPSLLSGNYAFTGATAAPLQHRVGAPTVSEQQLINVLRGNELVQPTRPEREARAVPTMLAHELPISAGSSRSAVTTAAVTRSSQGTTQSSLDRVVQSIGLVSQMRQERSDARNIPWHTPPPPPTPMAEDIRESRQTEPEVPVIYEGMDETCSICQEEFQHGQRVCRLSCRHMFHSTCWVRAQHNYNDDMTCLLYTSPSPRD